MSQQYSLRWNNHQPNFISMFTSLLSTKTLVDVTLAAEGQHLVAHKVVLSACSTYFQALFVDNPSRHPIVILKDVLFADLQTIVDFMYYGQVNVTEEQLPKVLDTAKMLKIKGLTEMPESTSLTRSQGSSADFPDLESQRTPTSPSSPAARRKRRRVSSSSSTPDGVTTRLVEDARPEEQHAVELPRDGITLSSVPQQRRRDFADDRLDTHQADVHSMAVDQQLALETSVSAGLPGATWNLVDSYPRYTSACIGGGLQQEPMYMNNVMTSHGHELGQYGPALGEAGPSGGCAPPAPPAQPPPPPQRRRRTSNPQNEENFQRAIEAVRFGGIGFCKAARMYGVNNRTLWLEYKKRGYPNNRPSIKSRIKRENTTPTPPLELKDAMAPQGQNAALLCPPHPVAGAFIDHRVPNEFTLQEVQSSHLNILNVNFNNMQ